MTGRRTVHTAVVHHTTDELVGQLVPYVRAGLAAGEPVLVNLREARLRALEEALGPDATGVTWSDSSRWNASPGRRLRALEAALGSSRPDGRWTRFVGECPWPSGPEPLVTEWERFDAVLNTTLAERPVDMVCAYDAATLPRSVVERAAHTHPLIGLWPTVPSTGYLDPVTFLAERAARALPVPARAAMSPRDLRPPGARRFVRQALAGAPVPAEGLEALLVVVSELVTNGWQAGASAVTAACWRWPDGVIVQVDDDGPGLDDPFAGYRPPPFEAIGGRGLWIARQLSDAVEIASSRSGTAVRVHLLIG